MSIARFLKLTVLFLIILPILGWPILFLWLLRGVDYSQLPKVEVFQRVWRRPVPDAISDLRIAGHGAGMGHQVCMRFKAPPATMRDLIAGSSSISAEEFVHWSYDRTGHDSNAIGWDEIASIKKPTFYLFDASQNGLGWYGAMALDGRTGLLFLTAEVL